MQPVEPGFDSGPNWPERILVQVNVWSDQRLKKKRINIEGHTHGPPDLYQGWPQWYGDHQEGHRLRQTWPEPRARPKADNPARPPACCSLEPWRALCDPGHEFAPANDNATPWGWAKPSVRTKVCWLSRNPESESKHRSRSPFSEPALFAK